MAGTQATVTRRAMGRGLAGLAAASPALIASRAKAQPVTLKMWMHLHPPRLEVDKQIIAGFQKANPDVRVDYQVFPPSDYATKLLTAFSAGAGPDFFNWSSTFMAQWHHYGVVAPIDYAAMGYSDEKALTGQYLNGFAAARFGDQLYGVPSEFSNWACYTNNKVWQAAHLDPMKDFPRTWEDLSKVAAQLTMRDKAGVPVLRGFDFDWANSNIFYAMMSTMMHQLGVNIVEEQKNEANLDTSAAREVMQVLRRLGEQVEARRPAVHRIAHCVSGRQDGVGRQLRHLGHSTDEEGRHRFQRAARAALAARGERGF